MKTTDTTTPPFSNWIVLFLLSGPRAGLQPRDEHTREEFRHIWGAHGERCADTWREHEAFLREAAAERSIPPKFQGRFFAEAIAAQKGLR